MRDKLHVVFAAKRDKLHVKAATNYTWKIARNPQIFVENQAILFSSLGRTGGRDR